MGTTVGRARLSIGLAGSPPRAWGQRTAPCRRQLPRRFTPTGVGTTPLRRDRLGKKTVHPHGRGDNSRVKPRQSSFHGSPPRAWGQQSMVSIIIPFFRFTPTGVGTTPPRIRLHDRKPVHPHGRGDNVRIVCTPCRHPGSPPRAWGQRSAGVSGSTDDRFTPTGVGTTAGLATLM